MALQQILRRGFIPVDDTLHTNVDHIYAVGDINGGPQFTYISLDDYRIVAEQLSGKDERRVSDRMAVLTTMFITPPLSRVGLNVSEARAQGREVLVASKKVAAMPRPKIIGNPEGIISFVVDPDTQPGAGSNTVVRRLPGTGQPGGAGSGVAGARGLGPVPWVLISCPGSLSTCPGCVELPVLQQGICTKPGQLSEKPGNWGPDPSPGTAPDPATGTTPIQ